MNLAVIVTHKLFFIYVYVYTMDNIKLENVIYTIKNNQIFDLKNDLIYNINDSVINDINGNNVYNIINNFIVDLMNNLIYIIKNDDIYSITTISQYSVVNGQIVDELGNVINTTLTVEINEDVSTTIYRGNDDNTTINITNTELVSENIKISETEKTIINQYDDVETVSILNQINDYASKIDITDFQNKGRIEDYLSLIQNAQNIVNQNKTHNINIDLTEYNNLGSVADELSELFNQLTVNVRRDTTIVDKDFLNGLLITMQKLYNLSNVFGKFKEVMSTEVVINVPKSLISVENTLKKVSTTLASASSYITYFADSSSVTDQDIISNSQLTSPDLNNIQQSINILSTSQININNLIDNQVSNINSNINSLSSNITNLSNSLTKLKLKIGKN